MSRGGYNHFWWWCQIVLDAAAIRRAHGRYCRFRCWCPYSHGRWLAWCCRVSVDSDMAVVTNADSARMQMLLFSQLLLPNRLRPFCYDAVDSNADAAVTPKSNQRLCLSRMRLYFPYETYYAYHSYQICTFVFCKSAYSAYYAYVWICIFCILCILCMF